MNMLDGLVLILFALCIAVWPTQLISDGANRWLRIAAVCAAVFHAIAEWPRAAFIPVYLVALLFALLFMRDRKVNGEPSSVRESREGTAKKGARWTLILGCAAALIATVALSLWLPRGS
jgi:hypothetical protein